MKLFGHSKQKGFLERALSKNALSHAILFVGPEAVGKRTLAHSLAEQILCKRAEGAECDRLSALFERGNHPDFQVAGLDSEKRELQVDSIRSLIGNLNLKSYYGQGTVALVNDAHRMNRQAANALLKTLEEPSDGNYLFLVTSNPNLLPETIVSRCQIIHFGVLSDDNTAAVLRESFSSVLEDSQLNKLQTLCGGSLEMLQLQEFIGQKTLSVSDPKGLKKHLAERLKSATYIEGCLTRAVQTRDPAVLLSAASTLSEDKTQLERSWLALVQFLRTGLRESENEAQRKKYADVLLDAVIAERDALTRNLNPQLQFSSLLLRFC